MGERIVAYFDHIGGIEGHVVRLFDGGFAIELQAPNTSATSSPPRSPG